jgi:hypothetical protein
MSHLQLTKVATPAAPAANKALVFVDTADGLLKIRDAAGVVTTLSNDPNVALTNAANVFTANQQISAAVVSELRLLLTGTAKGRLRESENLRCYTRSVYQRHGRCGRRAADSDLRQRGRARLPAR